MKINASFFTNLAKISSQLLIVVSATLLKIREKINALWNGSFPIFYCRIANIIDILSLSFFFRFSEILIAIDFSSFFRPFRYRRNVVPWFCDFK